MGHIIKSLVIVIMSIGFLCSNSFGQQDTERRPSTEKWDHVKIQALVRDIDLEKREMILMSETGSLVTVSVDESVTRLAEVEIGDVITTEFWTYIKAEFREPTPEEKLAPLVVMTEGGKTLEDRPPGAVVGAVIKGVVTIEIINRPNMVVTVRGPKGRYMAIKAEDPELIQKLNVGEVVILTYGVAQALFLEKIGPKK